MGDGPPGGSWGRGDSCPWRPASSLGPRSHGSFPVRRRMWSGPAGTCRNLQGPQQLAECWWPVLPPFLRSRPPTGGPSMSPSGVNSNQDAKPTPEARRPGSRRRPVASGMFHGASVPRLILARTSRLSRWSRKGAAMEPLCGPLCHPRLRLLGFPHVIV